MTEPQIVKLESRPEHLPTEVEKSSYWRQVLAETRSFLPRPPSVLWHYTSGDGLIGMLNSGSLWSTHVSCLNDAGEMNYASSLLFDALRRQERNAADSSTEAQFLQFVLSGDSSGSALGSNVFVACLTEKDDDLSQWRGYAGGEGGYAIGFNTDWLMFGVHEEHRRSIFRVNYDAASHHALAERMAASTVSNFMMGLEARRHLPDGAWAQGFLPTWSDIITWLGPAIKHPAFIGESEWRFMHRLTEQDYKKLVFRQRRSMMARHFPLRFPAQSNPDGPLLPISHIRVGPSPHRHVSVESVRNMLRACGYSAEQVAVDASSIPFQSL
ncbi:DUF2971 domain-containing protein [Pseudoroseomonas globiformis]|uniref:DUF2971 domain-containing protein n=1 Tax=Teichococcus globiformis TaxID=2307229 RepID=A0ABV7FVD6_9PROT